MEGLNEPWIRIKAISSIPPSVESPFINTRVVPEDDDKRLPDEPEHSKSLQRKKQIFKQLWDATRVRKRRYFDLIGRLNQL